MHLRYVRIKCQLKVSRSISVKSITAGKIKIRKSGCTNVK